MQENHSQQRVHICFIISRAYHLFNPKTKEQFGGSELQLYLLATEISKDSRFKVSFLVGDYGQGKIENYGRIVVYRGVYLDKGSSLFFKFVKGFELYRSLAKIDADIYFFSSANYFLGLLSFFCKINNKKILFRTASDIDCNLQFIKKNLILGRLFKYGLESSDLVLTQSNDHQILLRKNHGIFAQILRNSISLKTDSKKTYTKKHVLWVSSCQKLKRPTLFLKLAYENPTEKFVMICPPSSIDKEYWEIIFQKSKNIPNLTFLKFVSFSKIQKYFHEAKIFVNTSEFEGFPNTFLQAGLMKIPILSLKVNPDHFISRYDCGYCCENDYREMVVKFRKLIENKKDWKKKSDEVFKYVHKYHDIDENIRRLKILILNMKQNG
ncbi:MAG: glycosyltransferase [archaeon]